MRYKIRKKRGKLYIIIAIIFIIIIALMISIEKSIGKVAIMQGEYYSKLVADKTINTVITEYLEENMYTYNDFASMIYDDNGNPVRIEVMSYNVNKVQSDLSLEINKKFSSNKRVKTKIPLGSLMDSYLMSGKGPTIPLYISSIKNTNVKLISDFSSAGVNQTCHRISAVITVEINSNIPLYSFSTESQFEFLIAENVIVGDVPSYRVSYLS